jgi:hypothetical protein
MIGHFLISIQSQLEKKNHLPIWQPCLSRTEIKSECMLFVSLCKRSRVILFHTPKIATFRTSTESYINKKDPYGTKSAPGWSAKLSTRDKRRVLQVASNSTKSCPQNCSRPKPRDFGLDDSAASHKNSSNRIRKNPTFSWSSATTHAKNTELRPRKNFPDSPLANVKPQNFGYFDVLYNYSL